jgi:hypothetical protein
MTNNYAVIENGKVINIVVSDADFAAQQGWVLLPEGAGIDWDYVDEEFIDTRPIPEPAAPTPAPTKEQLLAQLQALSDQINALG